MPIVLKCQLCQNKRAFQNRETIYRCLYVLINGSQFAANIIKRFKQFIDLGARTHD